MLYAILALSDGEPRLHHKPTNLQRPKPCKPTISLLISRLNPPLFTALLSIDTGYQPHLPPSIVYAKPPESVTLATSAQTNPRVQIPLPSHAKLSFLIHCHYHHLASHPPQDYLLPTLNLNQQKGRRRKREREPHKMSAQPLTDLSLNQSLDPSTNESPSPIVQQLHQAAPNANLEMQRQLLAQKLAEK